MSVCLVCLSVCRVTRFRVASLAKQIYKVTSHDAQKTLSCRTPKFLLPTNLHLHRMPNSY